MTRDGGVVVRDAAGDQQAAHDAPIKGISTPRWAPDGETLCVGGADGRIRVYR